MRYLFAVVLLFAGFFQLAAVAQSPEGRLIVTQWVQSETSGAFQARIVIPVENGQVEAITNAEVTLFGRQGAIYRGRSGSAGEVTISDVPRGVYAITAKAEASFACYAMHIVSSDDSAGSVSGPAEIVCAPIGYSRFRTTVMPYLFSLANRDELTIERAAESKGVDYASGTRVQQVLRSDGGLRGILHATPNGRASKSNVFLIQRGLSVGRAVSDAEGRFRVEELQTGIYSLITVGPDGLAAVGFELVDPDSVAQTSASITENPQRLVRQTNPAARVTLEIYVIPVTGGELETVENPTSEDPTEEEIESQEDFPIDGFGTPLAGGGNGPGSSIGGGSGGSGPGGGAGGGGGGGGGGGLGGLAALAAVGAAVASSNDDSNLPGLQIASPAAPFAN